MPKKSKKTNNNGVKSSKKKKLSNKQIPPRIKLPPNSYLISITQPEDRRKGNGGCKPKDPVWDNYHILLVNLNSPPKNANIRACICKYCKKLIRKQKYPIKVSTLRCHGLQCQKTPAERKNLIIASNEKLKIKNALWTLHKTRNHKKLPTRRIYAHPSEAIEPVTYANIISNIERKENENNNIFEINNIEDYYHFHIRNNSGRICIGSGANINNTNNPSSIHGDIQHLIEQSAETSNALESMKTEINKVFSSYNNMDDIDMIHNQQQQPSINRSLPSTLPIPTLSTEPNAIPTLELEILPSLETRFPNAFANAEEKEEPLSIKEEPTTEPLFNPTFNPTFVSSEAPFNPTFNPTRNLTFNPTCNPTSSTFNPTFVSSQAPTFIATLPSIRDPQQNNPPNRLNDFDVNYQQKYEMQHLINNELFWLTIEILGCYNTWERERFSGIIQLISEFALKTGETALAPSSYSLRNGIMKQNLDMIWFKTNEVIYETGRFAMYVDEGGPNRQSTFLSMFRVQQTNFIMDLSATGLHKTSDDLSAPYIVNNVILELFLTDSTSKMVKLRRLMNELYKCDILGGIGHVLQNVVDLVCRLPIFSKTYNEMKALLNTMFNTGFIYILKEKMGLDKLAVVSKPWCSNATEWNKPYNMGNWLLCRREVIKDSMVDGRSGKFFTSDKRDEWTSDDKFDVISLILSYYRPWKIEIMFHSREKSYLSDLVVTFTRVVVALEYRFLDKAGGMFVIHESCNDKEEKDEIDDIDDLKIDIKNIPTISATLITKYAIAQRKFVSNKKLIFFDIEDVTGKLVRVSAEHHTPIADKLLSYFMNRWNKHIFIEKICVCFVLDVTLRDEEILNRDTFFNTGCIKINQMVSEKIGGDNYTDVLRKLLDFQESKGTFGRDTFDISQKSKNELIQFDRALPWRQYHVMNNSDIIGKEIAYIAIGSLNPKPSNIDMERVMKGFNYVNRDLQLHKSMKLKYNEIFLRHNLKSLQKLGRI